MELFTGDDTGLMKRVDLVGLGSTGHTARRWGTQEYGGGVGSVCFGPSEEYIGMGLDTGAVKFWRADGADGEPVLALTAHAQARLGTSALHATASRVIASDRHGGVRVWPWPTEAVVAAEPATFEMGGSTTACAIEAAGTLIAGGGRDRDVAVWDIEQGAEAFKARNVPHDNLDLSVPVWVSAVKFLPQQKKRLVVTTGFVDQRLRGEVRLYDVSAQRRPVARAIAPLGDEALSAVECSLDGNSVFAGSVSGTIARLDVRMNLKVMGRFKGAAGTIRALSVHPSSPLLASASLDRHVRVYKLDGTAARDTPPLCKIYLKQRLTALIFSSALPKKVATDQDDVDAMLDELPDADAGQARDVTTEGEEADADESDEDHGMHELDGGGMANVNLDRAQGGGDSSSEEEAEGSQDDRRRPQRVDDTGGSAAHRPEKVKAAGKRAQSTKRVPMKQRKSADKPSIQKKKRT